MSADPAAEAAFERWLRENHPLSVGVHAAFIAGWDARGREVPAVKSWTCEDCGAVVIGDAKHYCEMPGA